MKFAWCARQLRRCKPLAGTGVAGFSSFTRYCGRHFSTVHRALKKPGQGAQTLTVTAAVW